MKKILFSIILCCIVVELFAQNDTLFKASVQEVMLLNVASQETEIVSASKKAEKLFNTPLSASVVTREQIERAGCLSIPEALRLATGVIVREVTPGNYDIHIQGLDNIKPFKSQFTLIESTSILVMIDGRPVYNYFQGGTFWETLPIDISDLEAIEIIRGASSALYGSNAVTGVINLITSGSTKNTIQARATMQYGNLTSKIFHAQVSSRLSSRWAVGFSTNQQYRKREFNRYYRPSTNSYIPLDTLRFLGSNATNKYRYPERNLALDRKASNFWVDYNTHKNFEMKLKGGWQNSAVQKMYVDNITTPLTTNTSNSAYLDWTAKVYGLSAQVAYNTGTQKVQGVTGWHYNFETVFGTLEYEWQKENWAVRIGGNYQEATYDDQPAADEFGVTRAFFGAIKRKLNSVAAFARGEYTWKWFKLMGAVRAEKYNVPDKTYYPYQVALTYQPSSTWLLRIVNAQANQGAFMMDNFYRHSAGVLIVGNTNLNLVNLNKTEFGVRKKLGKWLEIEGEVFTQELTDLAGVKGTTVGIENVITNYDIKARQQGANLKLNIKPSNTFTANISISHQKTFLDNFPLTADYKQTDKIEHKTTPSFYGTLYLNWQASSKINLNVTGYYVGAQKITNSITIVNTSVFDTPEFAIFNANASYAFKSNFKVFMNVRNLSWGSKRQTFQVDEILPEALLGVRFDL